MVYCHYYYGYVILVLWPYWCCCCCYKTLLILRIIIVELIMMTTIIDFTPVYLQELCRPVSAVVGRQALRSSSGGKLLVPRVNTSTMQYAASCILSCCSFYLEFTSLTDSVVTKELHTFALQAA